MLSVRDAHARVIAAFGPLPAEMVSVADAAGRVLAQAPQARLTQPPADLARMAKVGASAFLIGESFMRQPDVEAAVRALMLREAA